MMLVSFGTRPEYIKMKSIIEHIPCKTLFTGQHNDLLKGIVVDYQIRIDNFGENRLNNIAGSILINPLFDKIFRDIEYVMVQGDTTTAMAVALVAFHYEKKVIHLEAGLRTHNINNPFPEELNRQLISRMASLHLCPTITNKTNLIREGIDDSIIHVVGNTGLDNININNNIYGNIVLITMHRRDNHQKMDKWFQEINKLAMTLSDIDFIIPLHPNPNVQKHKYLLTHVTVIAPVSHDEMINLIKKSKFIISDSGGLQEEASLLNKKIIICRKDTERPESLNRHSFLCTSPKHLYQLATNINGDYVVNLPCPYGDGYAWKKIKKLIK